MDSNSVRTSRLPKFLRSTGRHLSRALSSAEASYDRCHPSSHRGRAPTPSSLNSGNDNSFFVVIAVLNTRAIINEGVITLRCQNHSGADGAGRGGGGAQQSIRHRPHRISVYVRNPGCDRRGQRIICCSLCKVILRKSERNLQPAEDSPGTVTSEGMWWPWLL